MNRYHRHTNNHNNDMRAPSKLQSRTARMYHNGAAISIDDIDISHFSRLPRIPASPPPPPHPHPHNNLVARSANNNIQDRLIAQNQLLLAQQQYQNNHQSATTENMRSPSYIFYTGHGQYHKQEINLNSPSHAGNSEIAGEATTRTGSYDGVDFMPPPPHLVNYSFINKNHHNQQNNGGGDHPYSNVNDQPAGGNDARLNNFR